MAKKKKKKDLCPESEFCQFGKWLFDHHVGYVDKTLMEVTLPPPEKALPSQNLP